MRRTLPAFLALAFVSATLAVVVPTAAAERECRTVADTHYFFVTYSLGQSFWTAYNGLKKLDCPGILFVLCQYYAHPLCTFRFEWAEISVHTHAAAIVIPGGSGQVGIDENGDYVVDVDGPDRLFIATWEGTGLPPPGTVVDGALDGVGPIECSPVTCASARVLP